MSSQVLTSQGSGELIRGLEDAIIGMQPGGKRRALVPPDVGYAPAGLDEKIPLQPQPSGYAAQRQLLNHEKEALLFEVQLLNVRR